MNESTVTCGFGDSKFDPAVHSLWGRRMLFVGILFIAVGFCVSIVLMHVGLGIGILGTLMCRAKVHRYPGFWWAVAFAAWQLLSMSVSSWQGDTSMLRRNLGGVYIWTSLFVAVEAFRIPGARLWTIVVASCGAGASLLLSTAQFFLGYGGGPPLRVSGAGKSWTSSGFFSKHLTQGFQMSQLALLAWTQSMSTTSKPVRGIQWIGRFAPLLCILLTGGRTGLVGILSAWFAWFGCVSRRRFLVALVVTACASGIAVGWLALVRPFAITEAVALRDGRIIHWQVATVLIKSNPILGVGGSEEWRVENPRVVRELYPDGSQDFWRRAPDAHNSFLGLAAEHGIPAVVFYLCLLGSVLWHLWTQRQVFPMAWRLGCGSVACALAAGQFEHYAGHSVPSYGIFITLGFAVSMTLPDHALAKFKSDGVA